MKFNKSSGQGAWLDKKTLRNGDIMKLVSEAREEEGQNGKQVVAKCRVKGQEGEAKNVNINVPSKNALIDSFGDDSKNWVNKHLTVRVESGVFAGKRGTALYLIPEGYSLGEDSGGYIVITKAGQPAPQAPQEETIQYPEEDVRPEDIPF